MIFHASNFSLFDLAMGHKWKHSLHEVNFDISNMNISLQHKKALKDDLGAIKETEAMILMIMEYIYKLEDIL